MKLHPIAIRKTAMPGDYDLRNLAKVENQGARTEGGLSVSLLAI